MAIFITIAGYSPCHLATLPLGHFAEAAVELSTDHRPIAFGRMELGQEQVLAQFGTSHNQITCSSTNGQAWYLKISLLHPLAAGAETIPLEAFAWQVVSTTGRGTVAHSNQFTPFSLMPDLVYVSGPNEASGGPVTLQFRYRLRIPAHQVSGIYQTTVRFTFTELL